MRISTGEAVRAIDVAKRYAENTKAVRLVTGSSTLQKDFERN